jgi:hypothetical protein
MQMLSAADYVSNMYSMNDKSEFCGVHDDDTSFELISQMLYCSYMTGWRGEGVLATKQDAFFQGTLTVPY